MKNVPADRWLFVPRCAVGDLWHTEKTPTHISFLKTLRSTMLHGAAASAVLRSLSRTVRRSTSSKTTVWKTIDSLTRLYGLVLSQSQDFARVPTGGTIYFFRIRLSSTNLDGFTTDGRHVLQLAGALLVLYQPFLRDTLDSCPLGEVSSTRPFPP